MSEELYIRRTAFGIQYRCAYCRCSVRPDHVPDSFDCRENAYERLASMQDE